MGLRLKTPPTTEPVSLGEAKAYLRVDGATDEALIQHLIKASRQAVEAYTNRCLIEQTWTFEINASFASARTDDTYMDASKSKGSGGIEIPRSPFLRLDGKPVYFDGEVHHEVDDYRLDTHGSVARIHFGHSFLNAQGFIRVTFKAGYGDTPDEVPAPLKQAILMLTASAYENRTGANDNSAQPVFMNDAVVQMITPYRVMRLG